MGSTYLVDLRFCRAKPNYPLLFDRALCPSSLLHNIFLFDICLGKYPRNLARGRSQL